MRGAILAADIAHIAGLIAGGAHASPIGAHRNMVTTTTHKTLRGPRGAAIMCKAGHAAAAIDRAVFPASRRGCPHDHTTAAIAVAAAGGCAAVVQGVRRRRSSPTPRRSARPSRSAAFSFITGGTDNHLLLIDLTPKGVAGKPSAQALDRAGIETNYNTVPFDPRKPFDPSGLRIGTPAITTRGLREEHMTRLAAWMDEAVTAAVKEDEAVIGRIATQVRDLLAGFPMPGWVPSP